MGLFNADLSDIRVALEKKDLKTAKFKVLKVEPEARLLYQIYGELKQYIEHYVVQIKYLKSSINQGDLSMAKTFALSAQTDLLAIKNLTQKMLKEEKREK